MTMKPIAEGSAAGSDQAGLQTHSKPELRVDANLGQACQAGLLDVVELDKRIIDVLALLAKVFALFLDLAHQQPQLAGLARRVPVDLDDFPNFGDGEADPSAAQDFLNKAPISTPEQACTAAPLGVDQAFILVKAQRPR